VNNKPHHQLLLLLFQMLLVFSREDYQSDAFFLAAEKAGYKCNVSRNAESALECFLSKFHDVVIIDHRNNKTFDAEALCRSGLPK
jgi:high affinity cAMP-specific and IBMX-insensitive 3',5'-cyclic phosphodiesterase 8